MKINLCVSVPDGGGRFLQLLAESAARLASGKHTIELHFTCHGTTQEDELRALPLALPVGRVHRVERENGQYFHANSVTHSRCINALYAGADGDVAVICDYDGAFVARGWDDALVELLLKRGVALVGSPYAERDAIPVQLGNISIAGKKYQGLPNAICLAFAPQRLRALSDRLCDFAERFATPHSLPARLIANPHDSACYGLPVGSFLLLDTGSRIPRLIQEHQLTHVCFKRSTSDYQVLRIKAPPGLEAQQQGTLLPEEYLLAGQPFFVHYRKGVRKTEETSYRLGYEREAFIRDVTAWLDRSA